MSMSSQFDQSVTIRRGGGAQVVENQPPIPAVVAAADPPTVTAMAATGVTVVNLVYTPSDPGVVVGDQLVCAAGTFPVVAPTRRFASGGSRSQIFVTPCGAGS